jgi:hypothetical protein
MSTKNPNIKLVSASAASPEALYERLADLHSHLEWAGSRQSSDFRLITMDAPAGMATAGTRFTSTGSIPMSSRRWRDESVVTEAVRPSVFEFVTDASAGEMSARYRHRYEIAASAPGSVVTYTMQQESISRPMWRLAVPGIRWMTWHFAIPMFAGRGFRNLIAMAEVRAPKAA